MEHIKVSKVDNVILHKRGFVIHGSLHLTTHHLIFTVNNPKPKELREIWISYPIISSVQRLSGSAYLTLLDTLSIPAEENTSNMQQDEMEKKLLRHLPKLYDPQGKQLNLFKMTSIKLNCKDFNYMSLDFINKQDSLDVYQSIMKLTCLQDINQLYAFIYQPNHIEAQFQTWGMYNTVREFERQGLSFKETPVAAAAAGNNKPSATNWRVTNLNSKYKLCETYPRVLIVPKTISDNVVTHASKYRSKQRIPALSYYYQANGCTITRCSQPLLGIQKSRSVQDEKLIDEIFKASDFPTNKNLIIDARPTTNAMAQTALGAGSENMDNYPRCEKVYLGIDNIHVMRDCLEKLTCVLQNSNQDLPLDKLQLDRSNWLKNVSLLMSCAEKLIKSLVLNNSNLLIHCSDGWDRTAQVSSLVQLCIDPYYRTMEGFMILIEKEWLSFGHRFNERSGHLNSESQFSDEVPVDSSSNLININYSSLVKFGNHFKKRKHLKFTSPIFHQFLETVYQLLLQNPQRFQFNERFLRRLLYHLYSCQYGTFLFDNEHQRFTEQVHLKSRSVWDYFLSRKFEFLSTEYDLDDLGRTKAGDFISPDDKRVKWWWQLYGKSDEEMNGTRKEGEVKKHDTNGDVVHAGDGVEMNETKQTGNQSEQPPSKVLSHPQIKNQLFGLSSMSRDSQINLSYEQPTSEEEEQVSSIQIIDTTDILKGLNKEPAQANTTATHEGFADGLLEKVKESKSIADITKGFQTMDVE
ncbi:hypothetical protein WICPIJ_007618 [Wickerhamomyces pijperi]|uniref:Myotubularin phosphatase domain-containing protein n=1 Tax=Wickerhamomyces pijperi TaxID=599730 RepID=A0A9P8Q1F4_WICPI|nr:hypothetical protein WICPIJ_007618 [Wickerhamomyces pijperi]